VDEVKILVGSGLYEPATVLEERVGCVEYSFQPVWGEDYEENLAEAIRLCQVYQARLSVQVHKYIGVR
jgi:organic radical activating enzyme